MMYYFVASLSGFCSIFVQLQQVYRALDFFKPTLACYPVSSCPGTDSTERESTKVHAWVRHNKLVNSLAPGEFEWNFRYVIFKQVLVIDGWGISCEIALMWMLLDFTDDQLTLVQVMAWCRQATSHYLSQCWLRSMSPYGLTRPQWVKSILKQLQISIMIAHYGFIVVQLTT